MTRASQACALALLATSLTLAPHAAQAQSAEAEVLFREGRKLIKAGRVEAGCDKLDASERLESSVGTLLNLGDCREQLGKLASAWAAFRKAEASAKRSGRDDKRQREARRRAAALEPKLSNLVIAVPQRVEGLVIRRDDEVIDPAVWNTAIPLDEDTYTILAEAPGYKPWRSEVPVGRFRRHVVTVPRLEKLPVAVEPAAPPTAPPPVVTAPPPTIAAMPVREPRGAGTWTRTRELAVGVGLVGAGLLGGGIYYGLRARDLQEQSDAICPLALCDDADGLRLNDDAQDAARNANILYVAGGVAAAASVVTWLLGAPDEERRVRPALSGGSVGISYGGTF